MTSLGFSVRKVVVHRGSSVNAYRHFTRTPVLHRLNYVSQSYFYYRQDDSFRFPTLFGFLELKTGRDHPTGYWFLKIHRCSRFRDFESMINFADTWCNVRSPFPTPFVLFGIRYGVARISSEKGVGKFVVFHLKRLPLPVSKEGPWTPTSSPVTDRRRTVGKWVR